MSSSSESDGGGAELSDKTAELTIANDSVVTKYQMAGEIVNGVLKEILAKCVAGQSVLELCEWADAQLTERTNAVFKKEKQMPKGVAFPTCIGLNNVVCHFSPLKSDPDVTMADGDVVKIDLGAHLDGFIAVAAHTVVVGATPENPATGRRADVVLAAHWALEAAMRQLRPGQHKSADVTEMIGKIADIFSCHPVENFLSFQLKRHQIGDEEDEEADQIIQNPSEEQKSKAKKFDFQPHQVWAIDVLMSTGEGKTREGDARTTVYRHKPNAVYQLKMKASREFFYEAKKRSGEMAFNLRWWDEEKKARMGVVECERHDLLKPYKVLYEKEGEFVAQFKATILVMPGSLVVAAGLPLETGRLRSEHQIVDRPIKELLESTLKAKSKNRQKKKKAADTPKVAEVRVEGS